MYLKHKYKYNLAFEPEFIFPRTLDMLCKSFVFKVYLLISFYILFWEIFSLSHFKLWTLCHSHLNNWDYRNLPPGLVLRNGLLKCFHCKKCDVMHVNYLYLILQKCIYFSELHIPHYNHISLCQQTGKNKHTTLLNMSRELKSFNI